MISEWFLKQCALGLLGCLDAWVEKEVSLWQKGGFTAGSPDKSQYNIWSQGSDEHSRPRILGKAFPGKSPTGWCLLRSGHVSRSPALVTARKLGLFCCCHWWAKPIKEVWSLNYTCLSAACCFQVSSSNVLLHMLNKPTCFETSVRLHTVLFPCRERTQRPLPKSHFHRQGGEVMCFSAYRKMLSSSPRKPNNQVWCLQVANQRDKKENGSPWSHPRHLL